MKARAECDGFERRHRGGKYVVADAIRFVLIDPWIGARPRCHRGLPAGYATPGNPASRELVVPPGGPSSTYVHRVT